MRIAGSPTLHDLFANRVNDSIPLLWHGVLRVWERAGLGGTDRDLRVLGLVVGLGIVAVLWRNARAFGAASPVASLVMLELNPMTVCYGDSLRAYGPGVLLGLLSFGAVFRLTRAVGRHQVRSAFAAATLASLLSVHTLFYNAVWLLATCVAGAAVCGLNGNRRRAGAILGIGAACAASLAAYVPMIRARAQFDRMFVYPTSPARVLGALRYALTYTPVGTAAHGDVLWSAVVVAAVVVACAGVRRRRGGRTGTPADDGRPRRDAARFCLVALGVGVPAYLGFLLALGNLMQPFYFVALLGLVAGCLDGLLGGVVRRGRRAVVVAAAAVVAAATVPDAWRNAGIRMSNVDVAAARLRALVAPGDLIVLTPWWLASPFVRYYHGAGDVVTVPPMASLAFQRFDLLRQRMGDPHAIDPVLARVAAAARGGRHVWVVGVVGDVLFVDPRLRLPRPLPTWHDREYYVLWNLQLGRALARDFDLAHATVPAVGVDADLSPFEQVQVYGLGR